MGDQHHQFRPKAQGEDLHGSHGERSWIPAVEPSPLQVTHAGASRFLPLRTAVDVQQQRSLGGHDAEPAPLSESEGFHADIQATKDMLKQPSNFLQ